MEKIGTPPTSVFARHGYVQPEGDEWQGAQCVRYHTYLIPENHDLPDPADSAYRDHNHAWSRADALSVEKVDGSGETNVDVVNSEKKNFQSNDEKSSELTDCNLETRSIIEQKRRKSEKEVSCWAGSQ